VAIGTAMSAGGEARPRVAALTILRNEEAIVATCIGHLLETVGVDRVYAMDNGSSDRTVAILRRIAAATGRVVVDVDAGEYRQDEIITALAHRAMADGAEWVLPNDADEFLWLEPGVTLASLCARTEIGGYWLGLRNFLQARPVRREWSGSLATMCVSAIPFGAVADGWRR
jgi:hypothetical protein